eukprot:1104428_1
MQNHMKYYSITIVSPFGAYVVLIYLHLAHRYRRLLPFISRGFAVLSCHRLLLDHGDIIHIGNSSIGVRDCGLNDKLYNILLLFIQFFDCFVCFAFILILYVPCLFIVFY